MKAVIIAMAALWLLSGITEADAKMYKWYDEKGIPHFTYYPPPEGAKNKDGTPYVLPPEDSVSPAATPRTPAPQPSAPAAATPRAAPPPAETPAPPAAVSRNEPDAEAPSGGFMSRVKSFFAGDADKGGPPSGKQRNSSGRLVRTCKYPNLAARLGICPLEDPQPHAVGSKFKALVVDARKGSWSSCRVTRDGDFLIFVNKGDNYWETDAGVPACPFREGFQEDVFD